MGTVSETVDIPSTETRMNGFSIDDLGRFGLPQGYPTRASSYSSEKDCKTGGFEDL